jgi:hypothetical protein
MIWLTWRQFRTQAAIAFGALMVVAVVLLLTGPHIVHFYDTTVATCQVKNDCSTARSTFVRYDLLVQNGLNALLIFVPALIGMFWGAPLVAREFETGTFRLAWTEGVTRRWWMATKLLGVGLASMALAGLLSFMVTWWASPIDRVNLNRLSPGVFASRDIVPVGYAALAFVLGVAAGLFVRRTVPAMAVALVSFFATRLGMTYLVRPHFAAPLSVSRNYWTSRPKSGHIVFSYPMNLPTPPGAWEVSNKTINSAGQVVSNIGCVPNGVTIHVPKGATPPSPAVLQAANQAYLKALHVCLASFRQVVTYQPASRYWPFQWYETAIFVGAALLLGGFCVWRVSRRLA